MPNTEQTVKRVTARTLKAMQKFLIEEHEYNAEFLAISGNGLEIWIDDENDYVWNEATGEEFYRHELAYAALKVKFADYLFNAHDNGFRTRITPGDGVAAPVHDYCDPANPIHY